MQRIKATEYERTFGIKAVFVCKWGKTMVWKEQDGYVARFYWKGEVECDPNHTRRMRGYRHALIVAEYTAQDHDQ